MANSRGLRNTVGKILFARVGWMKFYDGPTAEDERPVGGGKYTKEGIGHEAYNFRMTKGRVYGFFQPSMSAIGISLKRIDDRPANGGSLKGVLVVFVSRRPGLNGGQVIVGWYRDAQILAERAKRSPGKPRGYGYYCSAAAKDCVLLPDAKRHFVVPRAGGLGRANICYPLQADGKPKNAAWMEDAVDFIKGYDGAELLSDPEADASEEIAIATEKALAQSQGQGFARASASFTTLRTVVR